MLGVIARIAAALLVALLGGAVAGAADAPAGVRAPEAFVAWEYNGRTYRVPVDAPPEPAVESAGVQRSGAFFVAPSAPRIDAPPATAIGFIHYLVVAGVMLIGGVFVATTLAKRSHHPKPGETVLMTATGLVVSIDSEGRTGTGLITLNRRDRTPTEIVREHLGNRVPIVPAAAAPAPASAPAAGDDEENVFELVDEDDGVDAVGERILTKHQNGPRRVVGEDD